MGKQGFLQKECKVNSRLVLKVIYIHNKMDLANRLQNDWLPPDNSNFQINIRKLLDRRWTNASMT